jgi:hypothetical protein
MADCTNFGAWFHYQDGTPAGVWLLLMIAPGGVFPAGYLPGPLPSPSGTLPFIAFDPGLNRRLVSLLTELASFGTDVTIQLAADRLYYYAQTAIPQYANTADDFAIACADAAPAGVVCPPGSIFDPATETCQPLVRPVIPPVIPVPPPGPPPIIIPPPIVPPPVIIPPPTGQPDPEGDEITHDLCQQMAANTATLVFYLQQLVQQQQGGAVNTGSCCAQVVAAVAGVTKALTGILSVLPSLAAPGEAPLDPVTCSQLTALFGQLVTAWNTGNQAIVTAISAIPGADPCVCEQLKRLNDGDPALLAMVDALIRQMNTDGTISSDLAQIALSGSPTPA